MTARRWLLRAAVCGVAAVAVVLAVIWWQERSLQDIERQLAAGDVAGTLAATDRFLANHPDHGPALAVRARALLAAGQFQESVRLFEQVGAAQPDDMRALATGLIYTDQPQKALPILEQLLQQLPGDAQTLEAITICEAQLGRHQAALQSAQRLATLPGHEATGHLQMASIYQEWGYPSLANEHYEQVLHHHPDATGLRVAPAEFFLNYGKSELAAGNGRRALELLERSRKIHPTWEAVRREGDACLLVGEFQRAHERFEQALRQDPRDREPRERLAEIALHQDDAESAEEWLRPVIERGNVSANGAYLLQRIYTALENDEQAEFWREQAAKLRAAQRRRSRRTGQ